jgi:hypothetical protein
MSTETTELARGRVTGDLLLVGSLPAESTEAAFRAGAELFGDLTFALPDGETGPRAPWVPYDRDALFRPHPAVELVEEVASPSGVPRNVFETPKYRIRGDSSDLELESWPRIDEALKSYEVFSSLRDAGVIPRGMRFEVCLPFPSSVTNATFKVNFEHDHAIAGPALEDLAIREIARLLREIPAEDVAIQWDVCYEVLDIEGVVPWTSGDAWERFAGPVSRLGRAVPEEVLMGFHLCYGTAYGWPMYEARDMALVVNMANHITANCGRVVDWFHVAGPRYLRSEDERFFRPLADLDVGATRVFLGIILPIDGVAGLQRRHRTASKFLSDFGVAMYCGFGRQPGEEPMETMREHARVVRAGLGRN